MILQNLAIDTAIAIALSFTFAKVLPPLLRRFQPYAKVIDAALDAADRTIISEGVPATALTDSYLFKLGRQIIDEIADAGDLSEQTKARLAARFAARFDRGVVAQKALALGLRKIEEWEYKPLGWTSNSAAWDEGLPIKQRELKLKFGNETPTERGDYFVVANTPGMQPDEHIIHFLICEWLGDGWDCEQDRIEFEDGSSTIITPEHFTEWALIDPSLFGSIAEEIVAIHQARERLEGML